MDRAVIVCFLPVFLNVPLILQRGFPFISSPARKLIFLLVHLLFALLQLGLALAIAEQSGLGRRYLNRLLTELVSICGHIRR